MTLIKNQLRLLSLFFWIGCTLHVTAQVASPDHNIKSKKIHYTPEDGDFVLKNGSRKFNRALYGTNTGFRVEAGDLPEFALYMPGMGGNFKLGIATKFDSKWITTCDSINTRYSSGIMFYEIRDRLLQEGVIKVKVIAHAQNEAMLLKVETQNIPKGIRLIWLYGGASGKKFHRDGDIGADPESVFYLKPNYCINNEYTLEKESFLLNFGSENNKKKTGNNRTIVGSFPKSKVKLVAVNQDKTPIDLFKTEVNSLPVIIGEIQLKSENALFWKLENNDTLKTIKQSKLEAEFKAGLQKVKTLTSRVKLETPDSYINTLGSALAIAGDAIWESPAYLHGSVAWRMHLNAWRGAYVADPLGWHDRAETHFKSYGKSQVLEPEMGPVVLDSSRNFARQKEIMGTAMFSRGYISRRPNNNTIAHHYDMNSVFINQLLRHYQWTGDLDFIKEMWPVVKRHLAWEKRNFDVDNDGLYDAYATIWASDGLQYSGGGVTYSSAYNYSANVLAASIAELLGEEPTIYLKEANLIKSAIDSNLWVHKKGVFAEYKDVLGNQLVHDNPGLWTIYHSLDENIANAFQAYQSLRYVDTEIPHIPVQAEGLPYEDLSLVSTSNWQPYTWSVNNVALAENLHAALAYWQGGRPEKAFKLWQSALIESMYLGASPGSFQQLSFYDAIRGELYRDFADPIGMAARSLVEGLFGIQPNAITNTLTIKPGFPDAWKKASLEIPDLSITFNKNDSISRYVIDSRFKQNMKLRLSVKASHEEIASVKINGKEVTWELDAKAIGSPCINIETPFQEHYVITIIWKGEKIEKPVFEFKGHLGEVHTFKTEVADIINVNDLQSSVIITEKYYRELGFKINSDVGDKTFFVELRQGSMFWWQPIHLNVSPKTEANSKFYNWDKILPVTTNFDAISLESVFNSKVTDVFEQKYLSPRVTSPTLQLPTQGIGNWCYPYIKPVIDDSGLRKKAGEDNSITSPQGIPFRTPSAFNKNNIGFVSQWDNYPKALTIPLSGKASHAFFIMAGTTNPMQSRFVNGVIEVSYTDGSIDKLTLRNPENWWPIEQDYFTDGLAFTTNAPKPPRIYLKTGEITRTFNDFKPIKGFSDFGIDGGAATILDLPLDSNKTLKSMKIKAIANEVVIGIMSLTLIRN